MWEPIKLNKELFSIGVPIGRVTFFEGLIFLGVIGTILNAGFGKEGLVMTILSLTLAPYVFALWYAKRFLDIWSNTKKRLVVGVLFLCFLALNIGLLVVHSMVVDFSVELIESFKTGAIISDTTLESIKMLYFFLYSPFVLFTSIILFKKGSTGEKQVPFTEDNAESFLEYKRTALIVIVIIIGLVMGWLYYNWKQDELDCLQRVDYRGGTLYTIDGEDRFKTQEEAMNYCLKVLN